jgi:sRNA-binding regulator protein Hfq
MPFSNRPREFDSNTNPSPRKLFRTTMDFKRMPTKNGRSMKQAPPETTNAENFYYLKQMNAKTPMVIVMNDGETIRGCIEWYDKGCLKVNREGAPNLLINKHGIKYLFKAEEEV